jgi:hypothetical protein
MSKPAKKIIAVKSKAVAKAPASKPKLAKRTKSIVVPNHQDPASDVEIEFEEEPNARSKEDEDALDGHLLASRDTRLADSDDEAMVGISEPLPPKDIVGSKARLLALMNKNIEPSDDEDDEDNEDLNLDPDADTEQKAVADQDPDADADNMPTNSKPTKAQRKPRAASKAKKTAKTTTVKRGPGRPPKNQKKKPLPRKGIQRSPQNPDSFVEVLYDQPVIMKKIFSFFKSVAAAEIQMIFRPKDIIFYAIDHNEKTRIRVRVDAEKLNFYYCRDILDVGISQKEMEMILNKVDKDYSSIVILSDISTTRRNLTLVFENDIQIDELHRIDLIAAYNKMEDESSFTDEDYTIKFTFPGKYFKKTVSDIKSMSSQLSITREDNESPLIFEYLTENKRIQSKHTVKDSSKIKLESNLADGETFRVDVCIDYLKPISSSQIADDITILVDENKSFMTKAYIDGGTIEIKTLTEIIDDRPEDEDD